MKPLVTKKDLLEKCCDFVFESFLFIKNALPYELNGGEIRTLINETYRIESICYFVFVASGHTLKETCTVFGCPEKLTFQRYQAGKRRISNKKLKIATREKISELLSDKTPVSLGITIEELLMIVNTSLYYRRALHEKKQNLKPVLVFED